MLYNNNNMNFHSFYHDLLDHKDFEIGIFQIINRYLKDCCDACDEPIDHYFDCDNCSRNVCNNCGTICKTCKCRLCEICDYNFGNWGEKCH